MKLTLNRKEVIEFIKRIVYLNRRVNIGGTNQIQLYAINVFGQTFKSSLGIRLYLFGLNNSEDFGFLTFQDIFPQTSAIGFVDFNRKVFQILTSDQLNYTIHLIN